MPDETRNAGQASSHARFSSSKLSRLRDVMTGYVERGEVPGLVALISQRGETHVEAIGSKKLGGTDPVRRDTIFRIASMTKPITSAAAMILIEECKLRLDDPIDHFIPELANRKVLARLDGPLDETVPAVRPITTRDLLSSCMGFGAVMAPPDRYPIVKAAIDRHIYVGPPAAKTPAPDEWVKRLGELPLMHQPGESWCYHTGSEVLSVLVARASGQSFDKFLHERIFEPLGMKDTGFSVSAAKIDRLATSYRPNFQTSKLELFDPAAGGLWSRPPAFPSGGGGLVSTVDDYLAFSEMLINRGKHQASRVLSRGSVEVMTSDQLTPAQKRASHALYPGFFDTYGWGFGMSVVTTRTHPAEPVGQFGWDGGLGTSVRSDPNEHVTAIVLTQRAWTSPIPPNVCRDFLTLAYTTLDA